jgi:chromosome segregation ATPase
MKSKIAIAVLLIVSLVLGGLLIYEKGERKHEVRELTSVVKVHSDDLARARREVGELKGVNLELESQLNAAKTEIVQYSNQVVQARAERAQVEAEAQKASELAAAEMAKAEAQIAALQAQVDERNRQLEEVRGQIAALEQKIAEKEQELELAKGDKDFLMSELRRMQTEKAQLERKFHDLALLRDQVRQLKEEMAQQRRIEMMQKGIYATTTAKGGATRQMRGFSQPLNTTTNFNLDVEIDLDGSARSVGPGGGTNAPGR